VWKATVAIVGLLVFIDQIRAWSGERRTTPAEAVEQLATQMKDMTRQRRDQDSAQAVMNNTLQRAVLQNSYSICILSKRPQGDCADILLGSPAIIRR
jgi:hypothetical protein